MNYTGVERVETAEPLTDLQMLYAELLASGKHNYHSIGELMNVSPRTVKFHVQQAAEKIPGDLPAQFRVVAWFRGATIEVLGWEGVEFIDPSDMTGSQTTLSGATE